MRVCSQSPPLYVLLLVYRVYQFVHINFVSCTLLRWFTVSRRFLVEFLGYLKYKVISSANKVVLTSFPVCTPLISFSCFIAPTSIPNTVLKWTGDNENSSLAPDFFLRLLQVFLYVRWCCLWASHAHFAFCWGMFPLCLHILGLLSWWHMGFCQSLFVQLLRWLCDFCL